MRVLAAQRLRHYAPRRAMPRRTPMTAVRASYGVHYRFMMPYAAREEERALFRCHASFIRRYERPRAGEEKAGRQLIERRRH